MNSSDKISIEEMKKIAHEIIEEEQQREKVSGNIFPITYLEYYQELAFDKNYKLAKNIRNATLPITAGGFYDSTNRRIVIFLNRINRIIDPGRKIFRLAFICYHESKHSFQEKADAYSYEGFFRDIEQVIKCSNPRDYSEYHDKYSFEIEANLYAISKAKEYLKKNYPEYYEKEKEEIERLEKQHIFNYMSYDASDTIERAINQLKEHIKKYKIDSVSNFDEISPVLEIFLNKDLSFKNLSEIIKNEKFRTLDKRIIYAFLSNKSFLQSIKMEKMTEEELNILVEALQYTNMVYQNQQKTVEDYEKQKNITLKEYLRSTKSLLKKYVFLEKYLGKLLSEKLKTTRNEVERKVHIKTLPDYLEKATAYSRKRSKGYTTINICYILGFILSIVTLIYLMIK